MRSVNIVYWSCTVLLAALMGLGAIGDLFSEPQAVALFQHLGYPEYLLPFLGVAKLLGVVALLTPGFPRLKEWAYAGFVFDLTGAMYSSISVGDPASSWLMFLIGYLLIAGSYLTYHRRKSSTRNSIVHAA